MRLKILVSLAILPILTSCATPALITETPCPLYPELLILDPELVAATPAAVQSIVVQNYILLDTYAAKLEVRAGCN